MAENLLKPAKGEISKTVRSCLRLFAVNPGRVRSKLYTATLLEQPSKSNAFTLFIEHNCSHPVILQLIQNPFISPPGFVVFESMNDIPYIDRLIFLLEHGFTVWSGRGASDKYEAWHLFLPLLFLSLNLVSEAENNSANAPITSAYGQTLAHLIHGDRAIEVIADLGL